jgi:hypothetical protein
MVKIVSGPGENDGETMKAYRNLLRNLLRNRHLKPRRLYENNITTDLSHIYREGRKYLELAQNSKSLMFMVMNLQVCYHWTW